MIDDTPIRISTVWHLKENESRLFRITDLPLIWSGVSRLVVFCDAAGETYTAGLRVFQEKFTPHRRPDPYEGQDRTNVVPIKAAGATLQLNGEVVQFGKATQDNFDPKPPPRTA